MALERGPDGEHLARMFGCQIIAKQLIRLGERAGTRTQDPLIKSQMLYRLSYALDPRRQQSASFLYFPKAGRTAS